MLIYYTDVIILVLVSTIVVNLNSGEENQLIVLYKIIQRLCKI